MNRSYIEQLVKKYQQIYRIEDWDIIVRIHKKLSPQMADTRCNHTNKVALINFYPTKDEYSTSLEKVVAHELFHVVLSGIDAVVNGFYTAKKISDNDFEFYRLYLEEACGNAERFRIGTA
jgi:hypothetical protein